MNFANANSALAMFVWVSAVKFGKRNAMFLRMVCQYFVVTLHVGMLHVRISQRNVVLNFGRYGEQSKCDVSMITLPQICFNRSCVHMIIANLTLKHVVLNYAH